MSQSTIIPAAPDTVLATAHDDDGKKLRFRYWPVVGWRVAEDSERAVPITPGDPRALSPLHWDNLVSAVLILPGGAVLSATDKDGTNPNGFRFRSSNAWHDFAEAKFERDRAPRKKPALKVVSG